MEDRNVYAPPESELEVPLDGPPLASRWARLGGAIIDGLIGMAIAFPVMFMTGFWDRAMAQTVSVLETVLLGVFGFVMFAVLHGYFLAKHGQTIGKKLVGTRIVSSDSDRILPLWKVLFVRYLPISVVANIPPIGGLLVIIDDLFIFRKDKRCVHDLIAGSKVIKASKS